MFSFFKKVKNSITRNLSYYTLVSLSFMSRLQTSAANPYEPYERDCAINRVSYKKNFDYFFTFLVNDTHYGVSTDKNLLSSDLIYQSINYCVTNFTDQVQQVPFNPLQALTQISCFTHEIGSYCGEFFRWTNESSNPLNLEDCLFNSIDNLICPDQYRPNSNMYIGFNLVCSIILVIPPLLVTGKLSYMAASYLMEKINNQVDHYLRLDHQNFDFELNQISP